jgi:Holliday junction resolvase RusA-like endonuclease
VVKEPSIVPTLVRRALYETKQRELYDDFSMSIIAPETHLKLTLPYPPSANSLTAVVRGRRVKTREHRRYAVAVSSVASKAGAQVLEGPLVLSVDVYRPRRSGDLDNTLKAIQDSLKGILWKDDAQIVEIRARRYESKENPRVEVMVEEAGA